MTRMDRLRAYAIELAEYNELQYFYIQAWAKSRKSQPFSWKRFFKTWAIGLVVLHAMIVGVMNLVQMIWG